MKQVRRQAADQFYTSTITFSDCIGDDVIDEVSLLLSETAW